jgi:parallel beta-helix repeat protein
MPLRRTLLAGLATIAAILAAPAANASASGCDRVAAPGGSNSAPGTEAAPYASFQKLVDSLAPGQVGCLRAGTYRETNVTVNRGGTGEGARVVVRNYPGERAVHQGRLYVTDHANWLTFEGLVLNGREGASCGDNCVLPSPTVNGDDIVFQDNEVTNDDTTICFNLGHSSYGTAKRVVIRRNRIHNCGELPATNHHHGIYLSESEDVQILDNVIYENADRGIQLYPNADRTVVRGNILDGNGQGLIFSGVGSSTSSNNVVENNIVTNATLRYNIESWYPDAVGTGNVARNNCVFGGARGNIAAQVGFTAARNLTADPLYVDRGAKDFRLRSGSPCVEVLAGAQVPALPIGETNQPLPTPRPGPRDGDAGEGDDSGDSREPRGKPGQVRLENVSVKRNRRTRRWRLRVAGHLTGWGAEELRIQVRRGSRWQTLGRIRNVRHIFRAVVHPHVSKIRASRVLAVRVVVPGGLASNTAHARAKVSRR